MKRGVCLPVTGQHGAHAWCRLSGSRPCGVTGETPLGNEPGEESFVLTYHAGDADGVI